MYIEKGNTAGDTDLTIPPFFANTGRVTTRIWGGKIETAQPVMINWGSSNTTEQQWETGMAPTSGHWKLGPPHPTFWEEKHASSPYRGAKLLISTDGEKKQAQRMVERSERRSVSHYMTTEVWVSTKCNSGLITRESLIWIVVARTARQDARRSGKEDAKHAWIDRRV